MKKLSLIIVVLIMMIATAMTACTPIPEEKDDYITSFDVPTESITCMVDETIVVPAVTAITKNNEEIVAEISVADPNGNAVTLDSRRFVASVVGTYVITYKITYLETEEMIKTRDVIVEPKPQPVLTLLNDFETEDDILINPDGDSAIWFGDNQQKKEDFTLNDDPAYVYNGEKSLKISLKPMSSNYWPGVKFMLSNLTDKNDFSDYYSVSMVIYNESEQKIWLKVGMPGKDVGLEPHAWTKVEILMSEMQANGIAADNLLNKSGSFYIWFTFETGFSPVDLYIDALYVQADDSEIEYDIPTDYVKVNTFTVAADESKVQNEKYLITAPEYSLSEGEGSISYKVYAPDGTQLLKEGGVEYTAGDEIELLEKGVYKVVYALSYDNGRIKEKTTNITVKAAVVESKPDIVYADFNNGLYPNMDNMGAVWTTEGAIATHNTNAAYAREGGSIKFVYTVAASQWPSLRFSVGKFPTLNDEVMEGLKKITIEIYNNSAMPVTVRFNTVAITLSEGWNIVEISEADLASAGVDNNFHFFITSNEYAVGSVIELYVDNVILNFGAKQTVSTIYADFNTGLHPNFADVGAVWANDGAVVTHNTDATYAKDGGSAKFVYTVAASQWPSFRFAVGKFPSLDSEAMEGLTKITMEIYNNSGMDITIRFNTVAITISEGWNTVEISGADLASAAVDGNFNFFMTSNEYAVGSVIELYVDNVVLVF